MAGLVADVYGEALLEAARGRGRTEALLEEAGSLRKIFRDCGELRDFLNHPEIDREEKMGLLSQAFAGKVSEEWLGLFGAVLEKDRQGEICGIIDAFEEKAERELGMGRIFVETAAELSIRQKSRIRKKILETMPYRKAELFFSVRPELLGGLRILAGDLEIDGSLKGKLERMRREMERGGGENGASETGGNQRGDSGED